MGWALTARVPILPSFYSNMLSHILRKEDKESSPTTATYPVLDVIPLLTMHIIMLLLYLGNHCLQKNNHILLCEMPHFPLLHLGSAHLYKGASHSATTKLVQQRLTDSNIRDAGHPVCDHNDPCSRKQWTQTQDTDLPVRHSTDRAPKTSVSADKCAQQSSDIFPLPYPPASPECWSPVSS